MTNGPPAGFSFVLSQLPHRLPVAPTHGEGEPSITCWDRIFKYGKRRVPQNHYRLLVCFWAAAVTWAGNYFFLSLFRINWLRVLWVGLKAAKRKCAVILTSKMLLLRAHSTQTQGWHFLIKRFLKLCTSPWEVCTTQTPSLPRWKNSLFPLAHRRASCSSSFYPDNGSVPFNQCRLRVCGGAAGKMHLNK